MARVHVRIPPALRPFTDNADALSVDADDVAGAIAAIERQHPGMAPRLLLPEGGLRPFVNVFVDQDNVRGGRGLSTPLHEGAVVSILPAVAGG